MIFFNFVNFRGLLNTPNEKIIVCATRTKKISHKMKKNQDKIYQILQKIKPRPAMYIGDLTLKSLLIFINGYAFALKDLGVFESFYGREFMDFVAKRLGFSNSVAGIGNMILAHCLDYQSDDINWDDFFTQTPSEATHRKSIALFYDLVEEFFEENK